MSSVDKYEKEYKKRKNDKFSCIQLSCLFITEDWCTHRQGRIQNKTCDQVRSSSHNWRPLTPKYGTPQKKLGSVWKFKTPSLLGKTPTKLYFLF